MASIIGLYTGGTTGALDGTLVSRGTWAQSLVFASLNVAASLHYRVIDDVTFDDPGVDTNAQFTSTAPTGASVSVTGTGSWGSAVTCATAVGANRPVFAKQVARQTSATAHLEVGTGGVAFATGTRLAAPADLVATPGSAQVALAWTAVTGATGHQARYRTAAVGETPAGAWSAWVATTTSASHTFTGLTALVEYDFEVTALDANGRGAAAAAAAAALQPPVISGTLTATVTGTTTATIVGPTATGTITKWQWTKDAGSNWTDVASTSGTFPSTGITGLTAGTAYTFGVRAVNDTATSDTVTSAEVTTLPYVGVFTDTFGSLDADRWATAVAGSATVSVAGGKLVASGSAAVADANLVYLKRSLDLAATRSYNFLVNPIVSPTTGLNIEVSLRVPLIGTDAQLWGIRGTRAYVQRSSTAAGDTSAVLRYADANGTALYYWNGSAWTTSFAEAAITGAHAAGTFFQFIFETSATAGTGSTPAFRWVAKNAAGTTTYFTTAWVNVSDLRSEGANPYYQLFIGEPRTDAHIQNFEIETVTVT